ncbi:MAG: hypothetical protein ABIJ81_00315 [Patescibacteria group bacterium]
MPTNHRQSTIKLARLALESTETPALANVWTKDSSHLLLVGEINLPYATAQGIGAALLTRIDELWLEAPQQLETAEEILEGILLEVNKLLTHLLTPYPYNPQAPRYHLSMVFFRAPEICVSTIGSAGAFVVSLTRFTNIVKTSVVTSGDTGPLARRPLFQQLISGQLKNGETLLLTNPGLLDFFSVEKLRQIIVQNAPGMATTILNKLLSNLDRQPPVSLIVLKTGSRPEINQADSLDHLIKTEAATAGILKPNLWGYFKSGLNKLLPSHSRSVTSDINLEEEELPRVAPTKYRPSKTAFLVKALKKSKNIISNIHIPWRRSEIKDLITNLIEKSIRRYRSLTQVYRVLATIVIVLVFIFAYSIVSTGKGNLAVNLTKNYQAILSSISEKQSEIEASLIYHDDAKVARLLDEARALLLTLPQRNKEQKQQYQATQKTLNLLGLRVLKQATINEPMLVMDLTTLKTTNWQSLLWTDELIAVSENGLLAITGENQQAKKLFSLPNQVSPITASYLINKDSAIINTSINTPALVNFTNQTAEIITRELPNIVDANPFDGERLYFLSSEPTTIYRITIVDSTVSSPVKWLRADQGELSDATSLTVDGAIYVLRNGNSIEQYIRGSKRDFGIAAINPAINNATKIRTASEEDYLYILEPATKRIIVIDKKGTLIVQLLLPTLQRIKDIAIDETSQLLYLLSDDKVYQVDIKEYEQ